MALLPQLRRALHVLDLDVPGGAEYRAFFSRREFRRGRYVLAVEDRVLAEVPAEPESDELRMLYEIIAALGAMDKALMLLYLDGNTYQEISEVLGISASNAATKINRLKEAIKEQVAADGRRGKANTV